jgi:hypothetical protein
VLLLLGFRRNFGVRLVPHACHLAIPAERGQRSHRVIEVMAAQLANRLGFNEGEGAGDRPNGVASLLDCPDALVVLGNIGRLTDEELDQMLILLPVLCLGQDHLDALDAGESVLNHVAAGAAVALRSWWTPDAPFLVLLTREQLIGVAKTSGATQHLTGINGWTKKRLVEELTRHFTEHSTTDDPADQVTRDWVPGLLRFPAEKMILQPEA